MKCVVNMLWDNEAEVWIATSEDMPGLVLEAESFDGLVERVQHIIPEMIGINGLEPFGKVCYHTEDFCRTISAKPI